jgi:hypothetical protein
MPYDRGCKNLDTTVGMIRNLHPDVTTLEAMSMVSHMAIVVIPCFDILV